MEWIYAVILNARLEKINSRLWSESPVLGKPSVCCVCWWLRWASWVVSEGDTEWWPGAVPAALVPESWLVNKWWRDESSSPSCNGFYLGSSKKGHHHQMVSHDHVSFTCATQTVDSQRSGVTVVHEKMPIDLSLGGFSLSAVWHSVSIDIQVFLCNLACSLPAVASQISLWRCLSFQDLFPVARASYSISVCLQFTYYHPKV